MINEVLQQTIERKLRKVLEPPNCSICLDPLIKNLGVFTSCGHVFHLECAINANNQSRKCPNCRQRSCEVQSLHYSIEEIDGVEQHMQEMLSNLSSLAQFQVADLLKKYEDAVVEMQRAISNLKLCEENKKKAELKSKQLEEEQTKTKNDMQKLLERKKDLKIQLKILETQKNGLQMVNEQQVKENETLKSRLSEIQYLKTLQEILQNQNDDAQIKQLKQYQTPQEMVQTLNDLYRLRSCQLQEQEGELTRVKAESDQKTKQIMKLKAQIDDLNKENAQIKEQYRNRKTERSQESSINPSENPFFNQKKRLIEEQPIADPYSFLNKKKIADVTQKKIVNGPSFGITFGKSNLIMNNQKQKNS